jgi:hypothetical protein
MGAGGYADTPLPDPERPHGDGDPWSTPWTRTVRAVALGRVLSFVVGEQERVLREPDGPPTGRQLLWLNHHGLLAVIAPDEATPITKAEAAYAIDQANENTP